MSASASLRSSPALARRLGARVAETFSAKVDARPCFFGSALLICALTGCGGGDGSNNRSSAANPNAPWYPSINAFEHHDSGRTGLFSQADFGGSFAGGNTVNTQASGTSYPSTHNLAYKDANRIFVYGGGNGDQAGSIGAFVARIDPNTLATIWNIQLIDTSVNGEWNYPGVMGILDDGFIYVVYGYRLSKVNADTGAVIATVQLPSGAALAENTAYNGFDATRNGLLVMRSIYRQAGCAIQGPLALTDCPDPMDIPASSVLVSVNPQTMAIVDQTNLPTNVPGRLTVGTYQNQNYVYLPGATSWLRYSVGNSGAIFLDTSWNPGNLLLSGQTPGNGLVVMNDWVVGQLNASPSATALSVVAVNQGNASNQLSIQPFLGDPVPPLILAAFSSSAAGGQAISWTPASVSADPETSIVYAMDALPGEMAAIKLDSSGLNIVWKANQVTTESIAITGLQSQRIVVGSDIPAGEIPGSNSNDYVVWRNAATGSEIARSALLPRVTPGAMLQPYYAGGMFYQGVAGTLVKLMPTH